MPPHSQQVAPIRRHWIHWGTRPLIPWQGLLPTDEYPLRPRAPIETQICVHDHGAVRLDQSRPEEHNEAMASPIMDRQMCPSGLCEVRRERPSRNHHRSGFDTRTFDGSNPGYLGTACLDCGDARPEERVKSTALGEAVSHFRGGHETIARAKVRSFRLRSDELLRPDQIGSYLAQTALEVLCGLLRVIGTGTLADLYPVQVVGTP